MAYPQYPGQYEPYAGGYAMPAAAPSGGTAITAGVLACIGAVFQLIGGFANFFTSSQISSLDTGGDLESGFTTLTMITGAVAILSALLLGVGAVMLFTRRPVGRILIAAGCGLVIVMQILSNVLLATMFADIDDDGSIMAIAGVSALISLIFPVITMVLALLPSTARWAAYQPAAAGQPMGYQQPNPYGYNPSGGYPAQPGYPGAGFAPQPGYPGAPQSGLPPVNPFAPAPAQADPFAPAPPRADPFAHVPTQIAPTQAADAATQVVPGAQPGPFGKPADDQWQRPNS
ncbi:hypothetical protein [Nocardia sp. NPDC048505]|uniref:hypothetical protein n=1 Tax=unclassified Nocardia TaxID=2637762 RepID=UPI0033E95CAA